MDKRKMKKLLILNLPYFLVGLFATNLGEAWRLAEGADSSAKILSFFNALPIALNNPLPSFHPLDLLIGILCGAGLRLAVYGRMIEIYLMVSLAPIPFSTFANREQNQIGQNYLRSLFALGFQGFLIIICVGIYAVLVQSLAFTDDIIADIWGIMGYTVLLCFTLFKTGTLAKSVFNAH